MPSTAGKHPATVFSAFKLKHGCYSRSDTYCCSQDSCCRTFSNKYTFVDHLHNDDFVERHKLQSSVCTGTFTPVDEATAAICLMDNDCDIATFSPSVKSTSEVDLKWVVVIPTVTKNLDGDALTDRLYCICFSYNQFLFSFLHFILCRMHVCHMFNKVLIYLLNWLDPTWKTQVDLLDPTPTSMCEQRRKVISCTFSRQQVADW